MNFKNLEIELFTPDIVEWRHKRTYEIDGREVILSGKCDAIAGARLIDYKTTWRSIDLPKYHDALQWRCYLALHPQCISFRYEVFQFSRGRATRNNPSPEARLVDHRHLELFRYDGLDDDVYSAMVEYYRFLIQCEDAGLLMLGPKADGSFGVMNTREERAWRG